MKNYIEYITEALEFPVKAQNVMLRTEEKLNKNEKFKAEFNKLKTDYMLEESISLKDAVEKTEKLARKHFIHPYTLDMLFILHCSEITRENYLRQGFTEEFFLEGAMDFNYKLLECIERTGKVGTFVADWNDYFLKLKRFTLGRFQFEPEYTNIEYTTKCGIEIHKGDLLINIHIPRSGVSLTDDVRFASYKAAYDFFKDRFDGDNVIFTCHSWLLYPKQDEFLNKKSNVLKFLHDFEIVTWDNDRGRGPKWRLYGKDYPNFMLPSRNSLEAAYTKWIRSGHSFGYGNGIIVFDGEKIVR